MKSATKHPDIFAALAAPFDRTDVKTRSQAGRSFDYITARVAMNRLDEVLGPENWWDDYMPHENSVFCRLTIRLPDGETLTKCDAGGYAGMADSGDDDKSGYSDAFKRAAVKFGLARYLYRDGVPSFGDEAPRPDPDRQRPAQHPDARPPATQRPPANPPRNGNGNGQAGNDRPPTSGKALFAWTKDMEQRYEVGLLKYLNDWSKLQDFPGRMVDWDADQVRLAHAEAVRKLNAVTEAARGKGEAYEDAISN